MASYLHKRREFLGHVRRAYGGNVAHYTPWKTVYAADTEQRAQESIAEHSRSGLYQHAIFHRGKRIFTKG